MVMTKEPPLEINFLLNFFQIICFSIRCKHWTAKQKLRAGSTTMAYNKINFEVMRSQVFPSFFHFCFGCKLFLPPAYVIDAIWHPALIKFFFRFLIIWIIRIKDSATNIMTTGTAKCKNTFPVNIKYLSSH